MFVFHALPVVSRSFASLALLRRCCSTTGSLPGMSRRSSPCCCGTGKRGAEQRPRPAASALIRADVDAATRILPALLDGLRYHEDWHDENEAAGEIASTVAVVLGLDPGPSKVLSKHVGQELVPSTERGSSAASTPLCGTRRPSFPPR